MLGEYASALGELDTDPTLRAGALFANGPAFTAGLDLVDVGSAIQNGTLELPDGGIDAAQDIVVAAESTRFAQLEATRGLFPFGGATIRSPQVSGWGNAMRWMLTAEEFGAAEGFRIGLVQEVVADDSQVARACELAQAIARQAPLGVQGNATQCAPCLSRR